MHLTPRRALGAAAVALATAAGTVIAAPAALAAGEVTLTALDAPYRQDFDTLVSTGTSSTLPAGWALFETGTNANTSYTAGTGSGTTGDTYSFGLSGSTERAFGSLLSGSLTPTLGVGFTNSTGGTITSLDVAYSGELWRLGAPDRQDRLNFQFSTDAASPGTGSWTDVDALDFATPSTTGPAGARDGNAAANRTSVSGTVAGLSVAPGATVWLRWTDFNPTGSDDGLAVDDFSITPHGTVTPDTAPAVVSTTPANNATAVPVGSDLTVTFSEDVDLGAGAMTLVCSDAAKPFTLSGAGSAYTLDPASDFVDGDSCTLTVAADAVSDADVNDPPDTMTADHRVFFYAGDLCTGSYTPAYQIQGSGPTAAKTGSVTTRGVVVGDYQGSTSLNGVYLQDLGGDSDAATSDAVFVFGPSLPDLSVGDVVWVAGAAGEFQGQTQVSRFSGVPVVACGTGSVTPTDVMLPFASADFPERYEGMLVRMPQTLTVTEHFQLGRFGAVLMSSGGRLPQPTNVVEPGPEAIALQARNDLNQIVVDDASQAQNPDPIRFGRGGQPLSASNTLRGGDTATAMVGVLTYTWAGNAASPNAYRLRPVNALGGGVPDFQPANPRPASAPARGADVDVRVAGMNLLNFFNTFDGLPDRVDNCTGGSAGAATDCRGADTQAEFDRQWPKTVAAITGSGADVVGIVEIENDGYGPTSAIQFLVDRLNAAAGAGTYAFVDVDAETGQVDALGSDAIKVGFLYQPAAVSPVGQTAALNSVAFVNGGDSAPRNRPALAQAFEDNATGARFVASVNHLKSKGSACDAPDAGDGQANCNQVRVNSARLLAAWLNSDPTGTGDPDTLIVGDLNAYAQEDPIDAIEAAGFTNLIEERLGDQAYSYVFDGQWGYLDHALATASMGRQVSSVAEWHIDADEPSVLDYNTDFKTPGLQASLYAPDEFRISDHDPVLVDLDLTVPFQFSGFFGPVANPPVVNTAKAGSAVPVKFSLGGNQGADVVTAARVIQVDCTTLIPTIGTARPAAANGGGVQYDPSSDTYTYIWKTERALKGTCQELTLALSDDSGTVAYFTFQ